MTVWGVGKVNGLGRKRHPCLDVARSAGVGPKCGGPSLRPEKGNAGFAAASGRVRAGSLAESWRSWLCSLSLHVLAVLLILLLPDPSPPMPVPEQVVTVEMVADMGKTASPSHPETAEIPQEEGRDQASPRPIPVVPVPSPPVLEAGAGRAKVTPVPASHRPSSETSRPVPHHQPTPPEDFDARLRAAARSLTPGRAGPGGAERALASEDGAESADPSYHARDVIGSQVVRHWHFDVAALGSARWVVSIHLVIAADGQVERADMRIDPRYRTDQAYLALIRSARNAVLASSPLQMPAGLTAGKLDMVLDFDPRRVLR